jgi:membrane protease YdiL (CAAX protease family)
MDSVDEGDALDSERIMPHSTQGEQSSEQPCHTPQSPRPVLLPLLALLFLTLVTQLGSLPYIMGRAEQMPNATVQSFQFMAIATVVIVLILTIPLAGLGLWLGGRVGLGAPLLTDLLRRRPGAVERLRRDAMLAVPLGLGVGVIVAGIRMLIVPYMPRALAELVHPGALAGLGAAAGAGVAEEVWLRLGVMTILAWAGARLLGHSEIWPMVAWPANVLAALAFGLIHLPQLAQFGAATPIAIAGTLLGNGIVGVFCGWLYWRRSLVAAILAHFAVDLILHVLPALAI